MIEFVRIFNKSLEPIRIIDDFSSLIWRSVFFGCGEFEIYAPATPANVAALSVGNFIVRGDARFSPKRNLSVGIIQTVSRSFSLSSGEMLKASGRLGKDITRQRLIFGGIDATNSLKATIVSGNVEDAARSLFDANVVSSSITNRIISFCGLGTDNGYPETLSESRSIMRENLFDYLTALLKKFKMSFDLELSQSAETFKLLFSVKKGIDRTLGNDDDNDPVIFSESLDNVSDSSYQYDVTNAKTDVLTGGSDGTGDSQSFAFSNNAAGIDRRETSFSYSVRESYQTRAEIVELFPGGTWEPDGTYYIAGDPVADSTDGGAPYYLRDDYYVQLLARAGKTELQKLTASEKYNASLLLSEDFRNRFDLGDLVTLQDRRFGIQKNVQIAEIIETQDSDGYIARVSVSDLAEE